MKEIVEGSSGPIGRAEEMQATGLDATATISDSTPTGRYVNMEPVLQLTLLVIPSNGSPPYPVTLTEPVSPAHLARAIAGPRLHVKVDPNDSQVVWIDWRE